MTRWLARGRNPLAIRAKIVPQLGLVNLKGVFSFVIDHKKNMDVSLNDFYRYLDNILKTSHSPVIIDTLPSYLVRFAEMCGTSKLDTSRLIGFLCSGEPLLPGERAFIKKIFSCEIFSHYTATEFGTIAQECGQNAQHALHINAEYFYVEIVNERGRALPAGETGRIIITFLDQEVIPFLRYDTGDLGHILKEACPCGRTLPLLITEGRGAHRIQLLDGRILTQFSAMSVFYDPQLMAKIRQFQIIREKFDEFIIKIVPNLPLVDHEWLNAEVRDRLARIFGDGIKISIEVVSEIPKNDRGKRMGFISKV